MDRDDAGMSDREDEARQGDTGMIGSESEEPGPGRDASLTDPDPVAASTDQPRGTVAMSEGDPMRTRLGSHVEGAGVIGYDVAAAEEGAATQEIPAEDRPGYEPEQPAGAATADWAGPTAAERDPGLAAPGGLVEEAGPAGGTLFADEPVASERSVFATEDAGDLDRSTVADHPASFGAGDAAAPSTGHEGEPGRDLPATYTGEEADVTGRPEYADRAEGDDRPLYQEEPYRADRPGGGGSLFTHEEPERPDRPGPQEPGVQEGVYDQEADEARRQRPSDGF